MFLFSRSGIDLGPTGRLALMAKLAAGTGMKLPDIATQALNQSAMISGVLQTGTMQIVFGLNEQLSKLNIASFLGNGDAFGVW